MARAMQTRKVAALAGATSKGTAIRKTMGRAPATDVPGSPTHAVERNHNKSKRSLLIERLSRPAGAGIDELTQALGWLPHTVRAALTGLRRKGYSITRAKTEGQASVYRIIVASSEKKPTRASAKHAA